MSKDNKKYAVLLPGEDGYPGDLKGGAEARRYPDGAIRNEKGYLLVVHPRAFAINKDNAAALARRKHELYRESFAEGVIAGANIRGVDTPAAAWRAVGQHAAKTFFDTDNARSLAALGDFIAKKGGFVRVAEDLDDGNGEEIARGVASGAVSALLAALRGQE
jgi:hypothetical protein